MSSRDMYIKTVWKQLLSVLVRMAEEVSKSNNALYWSDDCSSNAAFPFRGYVSFSRTGNPQDEDLVFSLDCKAAGGTVVCRTDFSEGDGAVVADGPSLQIDDLSDKQELQSYQVAIIDFLEGSKQVLEDRLR